MAVDAVQALFPLKGAGAHRVKELELLCNLVVVLQDAAAKSLWHGSGKLSGRTETQGTKQGNKAPGSSRRRRRDRGKKKLSAWACLGGMGSHDKVDSLAAEGLVDLLGLQAVLLDQAVHGFVGRPGAVLNLHSQFTQGQAGEGQGGGGGGGGGGGACSWEGLSNGSADGAQTSLGLSGSSIDHPQGAPRLSCAWQHVCCAPPRLQTQEGCASR